MIDRIVVTVKSFATLREVMDAEIRLDLPAGATVRSLIAVLTGRFPDLDSRLFTSEGTLREFVNILMNGRNIQHLAGLDTPLEHGTTIAIFPPLAGG